jgi:cell division protein FtsI (penicillin-binding protein 3)
MNRDKINRQRLTRRGIIVISLIGSAFVMVFLRLFDLMLLRHDTYQQMASNQYTRITEILVNRGNIYDRKGRILALNTESFSVYCRPSVVETPESTAELLSAALRLKKHTLLKNMHSRRNFVWVARKVNIEKKKLIKNLQIRGIGILPDTKRVYPKRSLASHVLGFVDIDNRGLEGIERVYNSLLSRDSSKVTIRTDAKGNILYTGAELEAEGNSIVLTIDEGLQVIVEDELDRAVERWHPSAATSIIMNPYTGEVLALANRPTFDPNRPGRYRASSRRNRAITDLYEPGSTFKIIMAAAALEEGVATLNTKVDCSAGVIEIAGKRIRDIHPHGILTLKEVIQKSSNVGAVKIALRLGPERFYKYVKRFGFGEKTGIDLIGESPGIVKSPDRFSGTTLAAMAIGYEVMVTPLQALRAYAAIANGGYLVRPHLLKTVISDRGEILKRVRTEKKRIISRKTAILLKEALKAVISEEGTGGKAAVEGNTVAGKTGTTRLVDPKTGRYSNKHFVSSFVGMVPADRPIFVIIVVLWNPKGKYYGGEVAAPVFSSIAKRALSYMMIPREDTIKEQILVVQKYTGKMPLLRSRGVYKDEIDRVD